MVHVAVVVKDVAEVILHPSVLLQSVLLIVPSASVAVPDKLTVVVGRLMV